jgi:hypothetical protein
MRSFIRHPASIPIDFQLEELVTHGSDYLKNISHGGLAFHSKVPLKPGTIIRVKIPLVKPVFQAIGKVTWCKPEDGNYEIGIAFLDENDVFRARMVEQICHIEQYKQEIWEKEGRRLSAEEAAAEWIAQYANDFPHQQDENE